HNSEFAHKISNGKTFGSQKTSKFSDFFWFLGYNSKTVNLTPKVTIYKTKVDKIPRRLKKKSEIGQI
ncbi:hypothetical protein, partial [Klebsiella pneumoniae]|uniref:hypothetical protein n=1 Tax=Klebsiella pneumoniae TaxID=573 RepID=UPI004055462D